MGRPADFVRSTLLRRFCDPLDTLLILANCNVLREGTDLPVASCILHLRPTRSSSLYIQMSGLGTRLFEGKTDCLLIDVVDVTRRHSLVTAPDLMGLPVGFDAKGGDLLDAVKRVEEAKAKSPNIADDVKSLDQLDMRVQEVDLWNAMAYGTHDVLDKYAKLSWQKQSEEHFTIDLPTSTRPEFVDIRKIADGTWQVSYDKVSPGLRPQELGRYDFAGQAIDRAEAWIKANRPHAMAAKSKTAACRNGPVTDAMRQWAKGLKIPHELAKNAGHILDMIKHVEAKQDRRRKFTL